MPSVHGTNPWTLAGLCHTFNCPLSSQFSAFTLATQGLASKRVSQVTRSAEGVTWHRVRTEWEPGMLGRERHTWERDAFRCSRPAGGRMVGGGVMLVDGHADMLLKAKTAQSLILICELCQSMPANQITVVQQV